MTLLSGLIQQNVDRHTRDLVTLTATASITTADHAGRTLLMGEVGADGTDAGSMVTAAASDTITLNGTTTGGGAIGDYVELIDIASNQYTVSGMVTCAAGSNIATMFSATVS
jgi:hypothetical protein